MLSTFFQKPLGIATVLGAAVGAPYAVFETDAGTSARVAIQHMTGYSSAASQSGAYNSSTSPNASMDFGGSMHSAGSYGSGSLQNVAPGTTVSYGPATVYAVGPDGRLSPTNASLQNVAPGQYGGYGSGMSGNYPNAQNPQVANPASSAPNAVSPNYIATRPGTSSVVPGNTNQLWDYTVGTPTLNQLQQQPGTTVGGGEITDLREVLRFDITPGFLPHRFARVTTVLSNVQLDGLRVPLVSGTRPTDVAGTLTYFFDASQALKRIQMHGLTGDPSTLAGLMVQYYGLKPEQSLGGQLFTARWNNRVTSVMHVSPAPIIYAGADHSKYIVYLELNQPSTAYGISDEASEILRQAQATQRW